MFSSYLSPFSWRYGSVEMKKIFSEQHKYELWRKIWISVASVQQKAGLVTIDELEDLKDYQNNININRILEIENETRHDVVAAIREYAEKAKIGGGKIHLGLTSMDVVDNAQALQVKEALFLVSLTLLKVLKLLKEKVSAYAEIPCLGYTHLQPAEPTTVGYRLAFYAQDLLMDYENLQNILSKPLCKGIKGAVGTQASFQSLVPGDARLMETEIMSSLGLKPVEISSQVYTRKIDYNVISFLASLAGSFAKFASDLRILQSPQIGEWSEAFGKSQVGSSAMPFKKNPINSEKICSLARMVFVYPAVMLENAAHSYLERTLDDSANKRIVIAEAFLAVDEILNTAEKILSGIVINTDRIARNLAIYAPFLASESILIEAVKQGADRQKMHEVLRGISMQAWKDVAEGKENPMKKLLMENSEVTKYISRENIEKLLDVSTHIGTAPQRAKEIVEKIGKLL